MFDLRPAGPDDAAALAALRRHVHGPHVAAEPAVYAPLDATRGEAAMRERLALAGVHALVAERDGRVVGYVLTQATVRAATPLTVARSYLVVEELAVDPAVRRGGVGRALMDAAEALARRLGLPRVELEVRAWNDGAARFYAALGYAPASTRLRRDLA